jgi:hypothetical protein
MRILALALVATFGTTADAKTLVYTYQGKPLELQLPDPEYVGEEMFYYLSLMPAVLEGVQIKIVVDTTKLETNHIVYQGIDYCGEDIPEADCQFFGPAVKSFTSNYTGVPAYAWTDIDLFIGPNGAAGNLLFDEGRSGLQILDDSRDYHWTWLDAPDDMYSWYDVKYRSPEAGEWTVSSVPLPATAPLLFAAAGALMVLRRRHLATG